MFAAIGAAIVLLVLTCFAASSVGGSVLARLSAIAGQASVFLAVACIVICLLTDAAISRYDRGLAQGPNDYTMVTGTDGETHLAALRAWRP